MLSSVSSTKEMAKRKYHPSHFAVGLTLNRYVNRPISQRFTCMKTSKLTLLLRNFNTKQLFEEETLVIF